MLFFLERQADACHRDLAAISAWESDWEGRKKRATLVRVHTRRLHCVFFWLPPLLSPCHLFPHPPSSTPHEMRVIPKMVIEPQTAARTFLSHLSDYPRSKSIILGPPVAFSSQSGSYLSQLNIPPSHSYGITFASDPQ